MFTTLRVAYYLNDNDEKCSRVSRKFFETIEEAKAYAQRYSKNLGNAYHTLVEIYDNDKCEYRYMNGVLDDTKPKLFYVAYEATIFIYENGNEDDEMINKSQIFTNYEEAVAYCDKSENDLGLKFASAQIERYDFRKPCTKSQILNYEFDFINHEEVYDNIDFDKYKPLHIAYRKVNDNDIIWTEKEETYAGSLEDAKTYAIKQAKLFGNNFYADIIYEDKLFSTRLNKEFSRTYYGALEDKKSKPKDSKAFKTYEQAYDFLTSNIEPGGYGYIFRGFDINGDIFSVEKIKNIRYHDKIKST